MTEELIDKITEAHTVREIISSLERVSISQLDAAQQLYSKHAKHARGPNERKYWLRQIGWIHAVIDVKTSQEIQENH
jgi:hypothetical protein